MFPFRWYVILTLHGIRRVLFSMVLRTRLSVEFFFCHYSFIPKLCTRNVKCDTSWMQCVIIVRFPIIIFGPCSRNWLLYDDQWSRRAEYTTTVMMHTNYTKSMVLYSAVLYMLSRVRQERKMIISGARQFFFRKTRLPS
jgi:hypothetical protein